MFPIYLFCFGKTSFIFQDFVLLFCILSKTFSSIRNHLAHIGLQLAKKGPSPNKKGQGQFYSTHSLGTYKTGKLSLFQAYMDKW